MLTYEENKRIREQNIKMIESMEDQEIGSIDIDFYSEHEGTPVTPEISNKFQEYDVHEDLKHERSFLDERLESLFGISILSLN